jgi:predicted Ser/Thr protein kinase
VDTSTGRRPGIPFRRVSRCAVCPEEIEWAMIERLGKYQIVEQIGQGGMGAVYKANDPLLKRVVALKVISENVDASDELRARFFREAQACARLSHPNIITIYDLGEDAGRLFIVMEYLEGEELRQVISQRRDLALESKLALMVQICEGLAYAHQNGIVHRDIKPSNVFISRDGVAKVLDFGVARIASAKEDLTRTGLLMGTLRYMSPEQSQGRVDERSDMFSAAAVFYELIAYHPPLALDNPMDMLEELRSAASPSRFRPDTAIPEDLGRVIERALRRDPEERFRNMAEMREALNAVRARLAQEGTGLRRRLAAQAAEVRELHARLVEQVGGAVPQEALPVFGDRTAVAALEAFCREGEHKLARLRERVELAGRLRPEYEQAMDRMRLEEWKAAEGAFEHLVREMPEHVGAQGGLTQARAQALRAAEVERERHAIAHAHQLMDELRQRAAPAAAEDEEGSWSSAEANRRGGLSALAEQSYGIARERFEAAAEQYRAAADALDRRAQQLRQAARRSLEEGQFAECLTLVGEVLTLLPDDSEAVALNLEAQRRAREEAERRVGLEERHDAAREEPAAGGLHGPIDAPTGLVEEEPDHSGARQLLDDARAPGAEEEARARRLLEEARERSNAPTLLQRVPEPRDDAAVFERAAPAEPARSDERPAAIEPQVEARPVEAVSPPTELPAARQGARPAGLGRLLRRLPGHPLALAVSGLLVVACAISFWVATSLTSSRRLQSEVDQGRRHLSATREEAVKVEADRLASNLFGAAAARERDGEQQAKDGRLAAALETMRDAAARYEEAGRAARVIGVERARADQARALMLAAKERAAREAPGFKEALARESEGDSRYGELAFEDAAKRFAAAARLFAAAPPPAPAPAPVPVPAAPDAAVEIREMLRLYTRVFEAKDLALLQQVRPGIRPEELSRYRDVFDRTRSYKLNLKVDAIKVSGDEAEARGRREDVVVTSNGETLRTPGEFRFRFKRSNNRWTIDAVR